MAKIEKTHAMRVLEARGVAYRATVYDASGAFHSGEEAAALIGAAAECVYKTLIVVSEGVALTPTVTSGLLPGITREFLFEVGAGIGVQVREAVLRDDDLFGADEAFLTSTTRELVPVVRVDDRTIGDGRPGPVTRALLDGFRRQAEALTRG